MNLEAQFPAIDDLRRHARGRVPHFVWAYLDSGTGAETAVARNRAALDAVTLTPRVLRAVTEPDTGVTLFGHRHPLPFGFAPIGMAGLVWPGAETALAGAAAAAGIPFALSTVAAATPEAVGPAAGAMGWFQLYPPGDAALRDDLLARARRAGFHTLVLTVDVPLPSRRERLLRAGLTNPMRITPRAALDAARRPAWAWATLRAGIPRLRTLEPYAGTQRGSATGHVGYRLRVAPDMAYLAALRAAWEGPLVVKGVLHPDDARAARDAGADAIWVSNHGGRQFDGAPASLTVLPSIRAALGPGVPVLWDGGVESALDILRAVALGADMAMLGRAGLWAVAALGPAGPAWLIELLRRGLTADMAQLGAARLTALPDRRTA
jgi:L-lactate dehydrogenase (cytochrome)